MKRNEVWRYIDEYMDAGSYDWSLFLNQLFIVLLSGTLP
jgi:hypothetical protein